MRGENEEKLFREKLEQLAFCRSNDAVNVLVRALKDSQRKMGRRMVIPGKGKLSR